MSPAAAACTRHRPWLPAVAALGILVSGVVISEAVIRQAHERLELAAREHAGIIGGQLRANLESELNAGLHLADGLASYIKATHGVLRTEEVDSLLAGLYQQGSALRSIGIAPGNRISRIFPRAGNEAVIGVYYPDLPTQWPAVARAIRERTPNLAGPLDLLQGGRGLFYRVPVFMADGSYWGLISTAVDLDRYLAPANALVENHSVARAALRHHDGQSEVFWGDPAAFTDHPLVLTISLPGAGWQLAITPAPPDTAALRWWRIGGGLLAAVVALLIFALMRAWNEREALLRRVCESEVRFHDMFLHSPVAYQSLDEQGRYLDVNERLCELLGYARDDLLGRPFGELWTTATRATFGQAFACFRCEGEIHAEVELVRGDAVTITVLLEGRVQRDGAGRFVRTHCVLYDITERRTMETQLRLAASVFANAQEGILITDPGVFIVDVNPAFSRITGYERDEVLGRTPQLLNSGHQDAAFYAGMWQAITQTGFWRGEIWNRTKAGQRYAELLSITVVKDSAGQISHYIGIFSDITPLKARERELERIAHFDPLTGLANRRLLGDRLHQGMAQTRRAGALMAVCVLDLDHFKPINDHLGHEAGDLVLVEIAQRLRTCVRDGDSVARLGGDEFVLLLLGLEGVEECETILTRILTEITAPVDLKDGPAAVSASIGVTLFPRDDSAADQLLRHADHAMYFAKQTGRNRYWLFNQSPARRVPDTPPPARPSPENLKT